MKFQQAPDDPMSTLGESMTRTERLFSNSAVPCIGLPPDWMGFRSLGNGERVTGVGYGIGVQGEARTIEETYDTLTLLHTPRAHLEGPILAVQTTNGPAVNRPAHEPTPLEDELRWLAKGSWIARSALDAVAFELFVEGEERIAVGIAHADCWAVAADCAGYRLTVSARGWPIQDGLILKRVDDLSPYFAGHRRLLFPPRNSN